MPKPSTPSWVVCQLGAREHYGVARSLQAAGRLEVLLTESWISPKSPLSRFPLTRRLRDRYHPGLAGARVVAPMVPMLAGEAWWRLSRRSGWDLIRERNRLFQKVATSLLERRFARSSAPHVLFSYSYAALGLLQWAKARGWITVLGQMDPGPEEERIVQEEHRRHPEFASRWRPAPEDYWSSWRLELQAADVVVVNSNWSRRCLLREGVSGDAVKVMPLTYDIPPARQETPIRRHPRSPDGPLEVLFLGQITVRKGIVPLLQAMKLLGDTPVRLTLAGPSEVPSAAWSSLPNVRWLGPIPRSEVGDLFRAADVFILPTLSDGFAITQIEAMAHGVPVISTPRCGEVVRPELDGLVVPAGDASALAGAVRRFAEDRDLLACASAHALERAAHFSLDRVGPEWAAIVPAAVPSQEVSHE